MRLNKKKLAALAMSAVMAASTMPFPVMAEELSAGDVVATEVEAPEVTASEVENVGEAEKGNAYVVTSVTFNYTNEKATATYTAHPTGSTTDETFTVDAEVVPGSEIPATCGNGYIQLKVTIYGNTYYSGVKGAADAIVLPGTGDHKYEIVDTQVKVPATHMHAGVADVVKKCTVCGDKVEEKDVALDQQSHTYSEEASYEAIENILLDSEGKVALGEDGKPQAKDDSKDAKYKAIYKCTEYDKAEADGHKDNGMKEEEVTIPAKTAAYAKIVAKSDNIKTSLDGLAVLAKAGTDGKITSPTVTLPIAEKEIELKDCSKEGSYTVEYYTSGGTLKSTMKFTVDPHHYQEKKVAVFKTAEDMKQCTVVTKEDGELVVTSNSCSVPVNYEEVTLCTTSGKCSAKLIADKFVNPVTTGYVLKREDKTAEPVGKHVIKQSAKNQINALVEDAKDGKVSYDELKKIAEDNKDFVKITASPACGKEGKVTVTYICMVDRKTVVETQEVTAIAADHDWGAAEMDKATYVAPTCAALGSYDAVVKCTVCGSEKPDSRVTVKIPRLKHTNETSVSESGYGVKDVNDTLKAKKVSLEFEGNTVVGKYKVGDKKTNIIGTWEKDLKVSVKAVTTCDNCDHAVALDKPITIEVMDVQKQDASGHAGRITLKATYKQAAGTKDEKVFTETKTYAYFSSLAAYLGRVDSEPEVIQGIHLDKDGVFRYYVDNKFDATFNGIADYNGGKFFVANGIVATEASGLNEFDGKWYFLSDGQIQKDKTGLALYDGEWFYITNGKLDTTINGLVPYNGGTFLFAEGRLCNNVNGLWQNFDGSWYFLALGQVQTQYTGVAEYDGAFFYVRSGKLATDFNGTVEYDGAKFKVTNGQLGAQVK